MSHDPDFARAYHLNDDDSDIDLDLKLRWLRMNTNDPEPEPPSDATSAASVVDYRRNKAHRRNKAMTTTTTETTTDRKVLAHTIERVERIERLLGLSLGYNDGPDLTADPEHADQFFRALDSLRQDFDLVTTRDGGIANWEAPA